MLRIIGGVLVVVDTAVGALDNIKQPLDTVPDILF